MPINPKFLRARALERRNRDIAHLRLVTWLTLRSCGRVIGQTPLMPFSMRHRMELRLAGNSLVCGGTILPADVFLFLWRLHPFYVRPCFDREQFVAHLAVSRFKFVRLWLALGSFRSARAHRRLTRLVARCDQVAVVAAINEFLDIAEQDAPGVPVATVSGVAPQTHDADNLLTWMMGRYGMEYNEALDMPVAVTNQLYREYMLQQPDGELNVFSPSDRLLGK